FPAPIAIPGNVRKPFFDTKGPRTITPSASRYDVVIFPPVFFEYRFQRPQHLAVEFAKGGHRVFWVSPTKTVPEYGDSAYQLFSIAENLVEAHFREPIPNIYLEPMETSAAARIADALVQLFDANGSEAPCLLVQYPFWRPVALALKARIPCA